MKQRRKQPELTRERILAAAGAEFARHGYAGSGIAGMVAAADLTKGALFHHFDDKPALALAWVREVLAGMIRERWVEPLAVVDSLAGLKRLCRQRLEQTAPDDPTFMLATMAVELGRQGGVLAEAVGMVFGELRSAFTTALEAGKQAGWIYPAVKPVGEAALWVALVTGGLLQAETGLETGVRQAWLNAMDDYLDTLRNP